MLISRCIGCGAMREDERCERCDYERLELVEAAEYEALLSASEAATRRSRECLPLVDSLARQEPNDDDDFERAFRSAQERARAILRALGSPPPSPAAEPEPEVVWRCRVCGAVDAPQECLGICIWRRFAWTRLDTYQAALADTLAKTLRAESLTALVRLLASTRPLPGTWERNWRALQQRAAELS